MHTKMQLTIEPITFNRLDLSPFRCGLPSNPRKLFLYSFEDTLYYSSLSLLGRTL